MPSSDKNLSVKFYGIVAVIFVFLTWFLWQFSFGTPDISNTEGFGQVGDAFTPLNTLYAGLSVVAFVIALLLQREELFETRTLLKLQYQEMKSANQQQREQINFTKYSFQKDELEKSKNFYEDLIEKDLSTLQKLNEGLKDSLFKVEEINENLSEEKYKSPLAQTLLTAQLEMIQKTQDEAEVAVSDINKNIEGSLKEKEKIVSSILQIISLLSPPTESAPSPAEGNNDK